MTWVKSSVESNGAGCVGYKRGEEVNCGGISRTLAVCSPGLLLLLL